MQIQLLTHVMAQPYTREQWDYEVAAVSSVDNVRLFSLCARVVISERRSLGPRFQGRHSIRFGCLRSGFFDCG